MFRTIQVQEKKPIISSLLKILTILASITLILSSIAVFYPPFFRYEEDLKQIVGSSIFVILFIQIVRAFVYIFLKSRNAKTTGDLILKENEITAEDMIYRLEHITKIRFVGNDVKGEFRGFISKGSNNKMILSLVDGVEKTFYFEQTKQRRLKNYNDILHSYVSQNKLSKVNYEAILNNTNYY